MNAMLCVKMMELIFQMQQNRWYNQIIIKPNNNPGFVF